MPCIIVDKLLPWIQNGAETVYLCLITEESGPLHVIERGLAQPPVNEALICQNKTCDFINMIRGFYLLDDPFDVVFPCKRYERAAPGAIPNSVIFLIIWVL